MSLYPDNSKAVSGGSSEVSSNSYGDNYTVPSRLQVAGNALYNFIPSNFRTFTDLGGTATATDEMFECETSTTPLSYGAIQSFRPLNYKVGEGAQARMGAYFPSTPTANTWLGVGLINIGNELSFGYNGETFGIWHRYGGLAEVQYLTITTPAGGAETASVTIDGTLYSIPITAGTAQFNAYEIAAYLETNITGWEVEQLDTSVILVALSDGDKTGAFTFSSTGVAVAVFNEVTTGVTKTSVHIPQSTWNRNKLSELDPSKGNNYQILFKDGFGNIDFYVEDENSGEYIHVHTIKWTNKQTTHSIGNPSMRVGCYATSVGATTQVKVRASDLSGFTLGSNVRTRNPRAMNNTKNVDTTLTNVLTLRNAREYNGKNNQVEIKPLEISVANDGAKTAVFEVRGNPTVAGPTNFQAVGTNLVSEKEVAGGTVTEDGRLLTSFTIAKGQSQVIHVDDLDIAIPPTLRFVIAAKMASGAAADLSASVTYYEDL